MKTLSDQRVSQLMSQRPNAKIHGFGQAILTAVTKSYCQVVQAKLKNIMGKGMKPDLYEVRERSKEVVVWEVEHRYPLMLTKLRQYITLYFELMEAGWRLTLIRKSATTGVEEEVDLDGAGRFIEFLIATGHKDYATALTSFEMQRAAQDSRLLREAVEAAEKARVEGA